MAVVLSNLMFGGLLCSNKNLVQFNRPQLWSQVKPTLRSYIIIVMFMMVEARLRAYYMPDSLLTLFINSYLIFKKKLWYKYKKGTCPVLHTCPATDGLKFKKFWL